MTVYAAIQPNGERIHVEEWAVRAWQCGTLRDPLITTPLTRAVEIRLADWPLAAWEEEARKSALARKVTP